MRCSPMTKASPARPGPPAIPSFSPKFANSYFKRTDEAIEAGLTCGVALPVFAGEFLMAVMVLFCGDDEKHVGAIELWHNDPEKSHEMGLVDGYYGTADMFEFNSRHTKFPRGFGLPGPGLEGRHAPDHQGPAQRQEFSAMGGSIRNRNQLRRRHSLQHVIGSDLGRDLPVRAGDADRQTF